MTPAARLSAAIEILDRILAGAPVEQTLTNWGRANRFAGSGDRHALRDLVFDALRHRRSYAALGGGLTGRGLILGGVRAMGHDPAGLFTGVGHAPALLNGEPGHVPQGNEALDVPDWLAEPLQRALGTDFGAVMTALQCRAPVFLRVNLAKASVDAAQRALAAEGIATRPVPWVDTALEVVGNERKLQNSATYQAGLVELQDASSQAVIAALAIAPGMRVLDYCAGGGGKALAMAALGATVDAHDIHPQRMRDLPARAARAGVTVRVVDGDLASGHYDLILADVPCSGSGSWRRDPAGKWALTPEKLAATLAVQAQILEDCHALVRPGGAIAYATCSLLTEENEAQVQTFLARHPRWHLRQQRRFSPLQGGDGFFVALLTQADS
ncbi:MAG: RsmB/NOP family class I SAM-dependent RNA methyltransferase [Candidatus Saccharibacteria bacterium]|nr:RsmB/NOP family class I SAM-dependent RNA methyltransferase [Pseudorhodobacter sp.]